MAAGDWPFGFIHIKIRVCNSGERAKMTRMTEEQRNLPPNTPQVVHHMGDNGDQAESHSGLHSRAARKKSEEAFPEWICMALLKYFYGALLTIVTKKRPIKNQGVGR